MATSNSAASKGRYQPDAILVAVDFSDCSLRALAAALRWKAAGGEVIVLHVLDSSLGHQMERHRVLAYDETMAKMRRQAEAQMTALRERSERKFEAMIAEGVPYTEICKIAKDLDCDLVVLGKYGTGPELKDFLFGGTAEKVVRGSTKPVLCIP